MSVTTIVSPLPLLYLAKPAMPLKSLHLLMIILSCAQVLSCTRQAGQKPDVPEEQLEPANLDVPLEQLSTKTHEIESYQLTACRRDKLPQACQDLADALTKHHRLTVTKAFIEASEIACGGGVTDACMALEREIDKKPPVCSADENIKPDGSPYSEEESLSIRKSYMDKTREQLEPLDPELTYCATRAAKTDPFVGKIWVSFNIDSQGRARVASITPEIENLPFRTCIVSVFERGTFTPRPPLMCARYSKPLVFRLSQASP